MASLVLGTVGAIAGSFVGAPQIGWAIGSALGGMIDKKTQKSEGPRLADLKIQVSTWGTMIPIVYGAMRVAGNVIWSTDLRETATTEEQGGKGGPDSETTTYSYHASVAVALCEGPITAIRKIWANGKLVYNAGDDANLDTLLESAGFAGNVAIYLGDESQLPDPTIEAELGAGNVPAHRGMAYVVFTNLQLGDYGNRIPNLEFEVITADVVPPTVSDTFLGTTVPTTPAGTSDFGTRYKSFAYANRSGSPFKVLCGDWNSSRLSFGVNVVQFYGDGAAATVASFTAAHNTPFLRGVSDEPCFVNIDAVDPTIIYYTDETGVEHQFQTPVDLMASAFAGPDYASFAKKGARFIVGANAGGVGSDPSAYMFNFDTGTYAPFTRGTSMTVNAFGLSDNYLYVLFRSTGSIAVVRKYDPTTLAFVGTVCTINPFTISFFSNAVGLDVVDNNHIYVTDEVGRIYEVSTGTAIAKLVVTGPKAEEHYATFLLNNGAQAIIFAPALYNGAGADAGLGRFYLRSGGGFAIDPGSVTLETAVVDLCERAGLTDVSSSGLTTQLSGFAVTRPDTARNNLEQLQRAFYFDAVESDNEIKFVNRGGVSVLSLTYDDLAARYDSDEATDPLSVRRVQETELPARVTVNFINQDADYQQGTESARRLVTESNQQVVDAFAIAMTPEKAAQVAEVLMYDAHVGRTLLSFSTSHKYAKYEPTDVVTLTSPNVSYRARILKKDMSGPLIKWEAVTEAATAYVPAAAGASEQVGQVQVGASGPSRVEFLDIPLLRDQDDDSGLYAALGGYKDSWGGAALYRSADNVTFAHLQTVTRAAAIGVCNTTLGAWTGGNVFDEGRTVTVTLTSGELVSRTRDELFNGANAALIGSEIVQFRNAVLVSDKKYTLSGLLRGRRGTEQYSTGHAASERFVLLDTAGLLRPTEDNAAIGAERFYKPVTIGQRISDVSSRSFTNTAIGLKPLSPVYLRGGKNSVTADFNIAWSRRTRVDREWRDWVDVALGETTEEYEIDVMNGASVVRTETVTTPALTYTSAMQTTDFGSPQATVVMRIYQMSSVVGRGFVASKTFS